jgi:NTP pyrophosphatase (non-canonical NTP hydrolase)
MLASLIFCCFLPSFLASEELTNLQEMQKFQKDFDEEYFEINTGFEKLRHVLLHLVKTTGKMANYCEPMEHGKETNPSQVMHEVLPDLLIHALQIANYYDINLGEEYNKRIQSIINRSNKMH